MSSYVKYPIKSCQRKPLIGFEHEFKDLENIYLKKKFFKKFFPGAVTYHSCRTYRCRHKIVLSYNKTEILIINNNEEYRVELNKKTLLKENKYLIYGKKLAEDH